MGYPIRWDEIVTPEADHTILHHEIERPDPMKRHLRRVIALTLAVSAMLVLAVMGGMSLLLYGHEPAALRLEPMPSAIQSSTSALRAVRRVGYVSVTGSLTNRSAASLNRIEAVVDLLGSDRHAIRTESAMVAHDRIAPGQVSDFLLEMADDSRAVGYRVRFKQLYGADLK